MCEIFAQSKSVHSFRTNDCFLNTPSERTDLSEDFEPELSEQQPVMCSIRVTAGGSAGACMAAWPGSYGTVPFGIDAFCKDNKKCITDA